MAKNNKMAQEAEDEKAARLASRTYILKEAAWEGAAGQEFGGKSEILEMSVGEIAGPFTYVGHQEMTTELGATTVHLGTADDGETYRLPIQATFLKSIDQAGLQRGDKFLVKRCEDVEKKRGKGAGNMMAIYAIKVVERIAAAMATK